QLLLPDISELPPTLSDSLTRFRFLLINNITFLPNPPSSPFSLPPANPATTTPPGTFLLSTLHFPLFHSIPIALLSLSFISYLFFPVVLAFDFLGSSESRIFQRGKKNLLSVFCSKMAPSTIRKAIGAVKDQTSISLAKVAGTVAPEMEVLVVKATSHDQDPTDEKYYREILYLTSTSSRGYIGACIATVSKRLTKTHDWIVALKSLMLVHRLLADGHPSFQDEILHAMRTGMRVLNMSDFRAEASSNSWDHAGFVRFYSMYLEEKVRCSAFEKNLSGNNTNRGDYNERNDNRKVFGERDDGFDQKWRRFDEREGEFGRRETGRDDHDEYGKRSWSHGDDSDSMNSNQKDVAPPIKEMGTEAVIGKSKQLLKILDRVLACRPAGMARSNRLVLVAFQQVVKESFVLYVEICETLGVLLDRFTEMGDCQIF
ncbi:Putative clathrin assembly protein At2g25430, partial [Linum grandiflorum]